MSPRLSKLFAILAGDGIDGLLLNLPANISYLLGYLSRDSYLIASRKGLIYITDSRYTAEAKQCLAGIAQVVTYKGGLFETIGRSLTGLGLKRVGFEERYLTYAEFRSVKSNLQGIDLLPCHGYVEVLRQIKDARETRTIRRASRIALDALEFIQDILQPGIREVEVAAELERFIRYEGALGPAFETIVAFGPNAAHPHHITSGRKLLAGEMALIDMGVAYEGYKSDLTRTFILGKITPLARKVYDVVRKAQEKAIKAVRPGVRTSSVDKVARAHIARNGFGAYFGHNLGHGVGLEVHEAPTLSSLKDTVLQPGMIFTVEPGIYLPGKLGVRIEDMVRVTEKGAEVLSGTIDQ